MVWSLYMEIINLINYKNNLLLIFLLSLFCFFSSLFIQILLNETPCLLCLLTRYGFLMCSIVCFFTLYYIKKKNVVFLPLISLILLTILNFYHLGVENHWWFAPNSCKTILPTLQELQNTTQLLKNTRPPCDKINFKILGLSMTLISFIVSALITWFHSIAITLYLYKKT